MGNIFSRHRHQRCSRHYKRQQQFHDSLKEHQQQPDDLSTNNNTLQQKQQQSFCLDELPQELLIYHIFIQMTYQDLCSLSKVSKLFYKLSNNNYLWLKHLEHHDLLVYESETDNDKELLLTNLKFKFFYLKTQREKYPWLWIEHSCHVKSKDSAKSEPPLSSDESTCLLFSIKCLQCSQLTTTVRDDFHDQYHHGLVKSINRKSLTFYENDTNTVYRGAIDISVQCLKCRRSCRWLDQKEWDNCPLKPLLSLSPKTNSINVFVG
ncbi:unnamed protein product [Didymodactylos carnosus]|nr:unnamed protein product [Didymodactylos carnosus]CAF4519662.1 unnamed protein product [Didymodactylos carnosus]